MFKLVSKYEPSRNQSKAIEKLDEGVENGEKYQVLHYDYLKNPVLFGVI